jgi:hypothetical protein
MTDQPNQPNPEQTATADQIADYEAQKQLEQLSSSAPNS